MAKVSVIVPTHSRPHLLPRAVESALRSGTDVEVIVVDDGSIDSTAEVCRQLKGIRYIRLEDNLGVAGARNVGILASSADYIALLDDDDLRLPGSLDYQMAALSKNEAAGFVCGPMLIADHDGNLTGEVSAPKTPGGDVFWELLEFGFPVLPISVVVRKECFTRVGMFQHDLSGIDDWDIFVRIAELYQVVVVDQPVSIYTRPTPSSGQGSSAQSWHLRRAANHQAHLLGLPRALVASRSRKRRARRLALSRIANMLLKHAVMGLCERSYSHAYRNTLTALRLSPLQALRPTNYKKVASTLLRRQSS